MTKTQLAALEINYLVKEFQFLINAKIDKIYHPSKKELIIQLYSQTKGKQQLRITPNTIYLTEYKSETKEPSEFCMFLRKKLNNARITKISQLEFERIIKFEIQTKETIYNLITELFIPGNILLTKENKIITATEYQNWKDRTIRPKETYKYPKKEFNLLDFNINKFLKTTTKSNIVKALAIDLSLGGVYAEEACLLSKIDKNKKPSELTKEEIKTLTTNLESLKNKKLCPLTITKNKQTIDITPFKLDIYKDLKQKKYKSYSEALDSYFSQEIITQETAKHQKQIDKVKQILENQTKHIKELQESEIENKEKAETIYKNYKLINEILIELKKAAKTHSWQEIKQKLKKHKIIKEVLPKEKSVVIEL